MLKKIIHLKHDNPISGFVTSFLVIFVLLYYGNQFFIGISTPGNLYVPALDQYFNYISWYRSLLLHSSSLFCNIIGINSHVQGYDIVLPNNESIRLIYKCLGIGIISVWISFVIAFPQKGLNKLKYALLGVLFIITINIIRFVALAVFFSNSEMINYKHVDQQHFLYNTICYIIIFFMMKRWIDKSEMFYKN